MLFSLSSPFSVNRFQFSITLYVVTVSGRSFGVVHSTIAKRGAINGAFTRVGAPGSTPYPCSRQLLYSDMYWRHLNKVNVMVVTLPEQNDKQLSGIPRSMQHGVWSILFAKHENVIFAHGAHTIKSGTWVKSVFFGSHILSTHVRWAIPFLIQQLRISANDKEWWKCQKKCLPIA